MIDPQTIAFPLLLTDCSAPGVRAGILTEKGWKAYTRLEGETGATLFEAVKQLLQRTNLDLDQLKSFAYCEGPGSTLGIRINSMALRTWNSLFDSPKPIYAYRSLVAARYLVEELGKADDSFSMLSDLRKNSWNGLRVETNEPKQEVQTVSADDIDTWPSPRFFIQQRIHSPGSPAGSEIIDYDLESLGTHQGFLASFTQVEKPEVFQTTTTEFKKWTPTRHR